MRRERAEIGGANNTYHDIGAASEPDWPRRQAERSVTLRQAGSRSLGIDYIGAGSASTPYRVGEHGSHCEGFSTGNTVCVYTPREQRPGVIRSVSMHITRTLVYRGGPTTANHNSSSTYGAATVAR